MKRRRTKKFNIYKILIILLAVVMVAEAAVIVVRRTDWQFLARETVSGWFRKSGIRAVSREDLKEELEGKLDDGVSAESRTDAVLRYWTLEELSLANNVTIGRSLELINGEHPIGQPFDAEISEYRANGANGARMNACIINAYERLSAAVKLNFGERLYISSSYRTAEKQQQVLEDSAKDIAAPVGASEHQAGLALDVYLSGFAGRAILKCPAGEYINAHCQEYGFIIRYPLFSRKLTNTAFEPWHIRYVGVPHAEIMYLDGLVLEEYMELLSKAEFYRYGNYLITRQESEPFLLPAEFQACVISTDNMGGYVVTVELGR